MSVTDLLSIQLYTLRSLDDLDKVLDTVAAAGFRNVEGVGSHLDDAANVKAKLDARGLRFSSSHVSLAALRERPDKIAAACRLLGFDQLFMPAVPPEQRDMDASGWRALGRELGALATRFAGEGIRLGYHNHNWELQAEGRCNDRARTDFRRGGSQSADLAGRCRMAGARRCRAGAMAAALQRSSGFRPCEGHRTVRYQTGRGRLGRCGRRRAGLA